MKSLLVFLSLFAVAVAYAPCAELEVHQLTTSLKKLGDVYSGTIQSHTGVGEYAPNRKCTWEFRGLTSGNVKVNQFVLKFQNVFDVEPYFDNLAIYNGYPSSSNVQNLPQYTLTGKVQAPFTRVINNPPDVVTVVFTSDMAITGPGFVASFHAYSCHVPCEHGICSDDGLSCKCDEGFAGLGCNSIACSAINDACPPKATCDRLAGECNCVAGWDGPYCDLAACGGQMELTGPGFTIRPNARRVGTYAPDSNCTWFLDIPQAHSIGIHAVHFDTEKGYDWVEVFNGEQWKGGSTTLGRFSGKLDPFTVYVASNQATVTFVSNSNQEGSGFELFVQGLVCGQDACGHVPGDYLKSRGTCVPTADFATTCNNASLCAGVCSCMPGWTGPSCSQSECPKTGEGEKCGGPSRGVCNDSIGRCLCTAEYTGANCMQCNPENSKYLACLGDENDLTPKCKLDDVSNTSYIELAGSNSNTHYHKTYSYDGTEDVYCKYAFYPLGLENQQIVLRVTGVGPGFEVKVTEVFRSFIQLTERAVFTEFYQGFDLLPTGVGNGFFIEIIGKKGSPPQAITVDVVNFPCSSQCAPTIGHCSFNRTANKEFCRCNIGYKGENCTETYCSSNFCEAPYGQCTPSQWSVSHCECEPGQYGDLCRSPYCSEEWNLPVSPNRIIEDHNSDVVSTYKPNSRCSWVFMTNEPVSTFHFWSVWFHSFSVHPGDTVQIQWFSHASLGTPKETETYFGYGFIAPYQKNATKTRVLFSTDNNDEAGGFVLSLVELNSCPKSCNFHGHCFIPTVKDSEQFVCSCLSGWSGVDCSSKTTPQKLTLGSEILMSSTEGDWSFFELNAPAGVVNIELTDRLPGSADIGKHHFYVSAGQNFPSFDSYGYSPQLLSGNTEKTGLRLPASSQAQTWTVGVFGITTGQYKILATHENAPVYPTSTSPSSTTPSPTPSESSSSGAGAAIAIILIIIVIVIVVAVAVYFLMVKPRQQGGHAAPHSTHDRSTATTNNEMQEVDLHKDKDKGFAQFDD